MLNKKILIGLIIVVGIFVQVCYAKHSDEYPIGAYSDITNEGVYNDCIGYIESGNFNYFRFGTSLNDHFDDADTRGLDVWFDDRVWIGSVASPERMSPYLPSYATNFTYEAEQKDENSPSNEECPDHYHYVFNRDDNCGQLQLIPGTATEYVWRCEESDHDAGYAVKDMYYKWSAGDSLRLDHQISYKGKMKDLYVIFNMMLENDPSIPDTARICEISAVCDSSGSNDYYTYELVSTDTTYNTILRKEDFNKNSLFTQFEYKIAIKDAPAGNLLIPGGCTGTNHLKNFNPRVYWFDKGDLWIDNITIEDDIYKKLKNGDYDIGFRDEVAHFGVDDLSIFNRFYELSKLLISLHQEISF